MSHEFEIVEETVADSSELGDTMIVNDLPAVLGKVIPQDFGCIRLARNLKSFIFVFACAVMMMLHSGCDGFQSKAQNEGIEDWLAKAEKGDAEAQFKLGVCYEKGQGVMTNCEEAVRWYRMAAEKGNAQAQCNLGDCYAYGRGVAKDGKEAVSWYRMAAVQENAEAQFCLGRCYNIGVGVPKDNRKAMHWFAKAVASYRPIAEKGDVDAQYSLGVCYEQGQGVEKDCKEALRWYRKAAEQGDSRSKWAHDMLLKSLEREKQESQEVLDFLRELSKKSEDAGRIVKALIADMIQIPGRNYRMGKTEVTQSQWEAVMRRNPSCFKGANRPVENVSWYDCKIFIEKLNARSEVKAAKLTFRLPTAEECEYACRAGGSGDWGRRMNGEEGPLEVLGWYERNSDSETHSVAQKEPNAWGLYDMHGNVVEWCEDLYQDGYSPRLCRGGGWNDDAEHCTSSVRCSSDPDNRSDDLGLRLVAIQD